MVHLCQDFVFPFPVTCHLSPVTKFSAQISSYWMELDPYFLGGVAFPMLDVSKPAELILNVWCDHVALCSALASDCPSLIAPTTRKTNREQR
jgi:hypothetical protein